jgi:ABC-2 type transport system permease protein
MTALVRSELLKAFGTRLWWGLLIPVALVSLLVNAFGGLFTDLADAFDDRAAALPLLLLSLGYSLTLTSVFAVVVGIVTAGAEFRHRTITTTYLTGAGRTAVLGAKMLVSALLGVLYAVVAALAALVAGALSKSPLPDAAAMAQVAVIGIVVCAIWAACGAALAVLLGNQVGALVGALVYLLLVEPVVSAVLSAADEDALSALAGGLPGNAADAAVLEVPARAVGGGSELLLQVVVMVDRPLPWVAGLLVLVAWTALAGVLAGIFGGARDVT